MKRITIILISLLIIGLAILDYFFEPDENNIGNPLPDIVRIVLIIMSIRYILRSNNLKYIVKNSFLKLYCIIIIYLFFACLFSPIGLKSSTMNFIRIVYPFLLLISCYLLSFSGYISKKHILFLYKNLVILLFVLIFAFLSYKAEIGRLETSGDNKAYNLLFCTPIIFLLFPKTKAILYYCIIILGSLIAAKRGAFLGVAFTFLIFIYSFRQFKIKSKLIIILGLPILLALGYQYFADRIFIFDRFATLGEDGGSGRDLMTIVIWEGWQKEEIFNQIFGSGWMSELLIVKSSFFFDTGLLAHNDWLQFLYDLGIVGILLLLSMFYALFKQIRSHKRKDNLYFALLCALGIFFMRSISGGTFGDTGSIPYLFIGLGFILGKIDRFKYRVKYKVKVDY